MNELKPTTTPKPPTVMENIAKDVNGARCRTSNVVLRLTEINAKLWGVVPEPKTGEQGRASAGGAIDELRADINGLHVLLDSADALLDRLEQLI